MTKTLLLSFVCIVGFSLTACTPKAVSDAQTIIERADSLRAEGQMFGIDEGDSCTLAQAYETLLFWNKFSVPRSQLSNSFAHACYHYGRLLREKNDPVSAMQAFINATHSNTDDYHILGRVYSNIGSVCHLAGEFDLAYDMYEKSADYYLLNGDSLLYQYGVYHMAFEKAEIADTNACLELIKKIENIQELHQLKIMTLAEMFVKNQQYDSAIYYANQLMSQNITDQVISIIKAQSFSELGIKDSAVLYASRILEDSLAPYQHRFNALYILSLNDTTLNSNEVRDLASEREDIRYYNHEPEMEQLSMAILLLRQNLTRRFYWWKWGIVTLLITCIIVCVTFALIGKKHKRQMQKEIHTISERQANNMLASIKAHINTHDLNHSLHWRDYASMKSDVDLYLVGLVSKLENYNLNEIEIRFCILTLLDFKQKQIAETLCYSFPSGVKTLKKRISNKLGTTPPKLKDFLLHLLP